MPQQVRTSDRGSVMTTALIWVVALTAALAVLLLPKSEELSKCNYRDDGFCGSPNKGPEQQPVICDDWNKLSTDEQAQLRVQIRNYRGVGPIRFIDGAYTTPEEPGMVVNTRTCGVSYDLGAPSPHKGCDVRYYECQTADT